MEAIIGGKLYDTEKAIEVYACVETVFAPRIYLPPGRGYPEDHSITIYKTPKGAFFITDIYKEFCTIGLRDESTVRDFIAQRDPDKYAELFGEVEEA